MPVVASSPSQGTFQLQGADRDEFLLGEEDLQLTPDEDN